MAFCAKQNVRVGLSIHVIVAEIVKIQRVGAVGNEQTGNNERALRQRHDVTLLSATREEK